jgi:hypothetical protein
MTRGSPKFANHSSKEISGDCCAIFILLPLPRIVNFIEGRLEAVMLKLFSERCNSKN